MRLPPALIEIIARRLVDQLQSKGVITSDHPERTIEKVENLLVSDLKIEDQLTEEARLLLLEHQSAIREGDMEYHKLLTRVKAELAAKRGYVI
jgi:hypothetical protein